jgi:hypothetical protein
MREKDSTRRARRGCARLFHVARRVKLSAVEPRVYERTDPEGEELVRALLDEIEEDERLSRLIGVDLSPPAPDESHGPVVRPPLAEWLRRAEEVHAFLASKR